MAFNNVTIAMGSGDTLTATAMVVKGNLSLTGLGSLSGTIAASGNVTTSDTTVSGPGTILFTGSGNQTLTASTAGAQVPSVEINKSGGTLTLSSANPIGVTGNWTDDATNTSTIVTTGSTVVFASFGSRSVNTGSGAGAMAFNNVTIAMGSGDTLTVTAMAVNGDLTVTSVGTINGTITMQGSSAAILTGANLKGAGLVINKTVGTAVSLGSNVAGASSVTVTSGILDLGSHTLSVSGSMSVGANGSLKFTVSSATTQLTVNGNLTFASGSHIVIVDGGLPSPTAAYNLIVVTGAGHSLTDNGVLFTLPAGFSQTVVTGTNGSVKISKA
jgi:hypothetical protein